MIKKINSKILDVKSLTKDTKEISLEIPKDFSFNPGQYILLELPIEGKIQKRAYSIASNPSNRNNIDLCVKKVSQKGFVSELFKLKNNSKINFIGPAGKFFINDFPKQDLVFIAVGTGIAPFKSMIEYLLNNEFKNKITLIHGYRHEKGILYEKELSTLEKEHTNFKQNIILSQPKTKNYKKGYVQDFIRSLSKNPEKNKFYICGMRNMIDEVSKELSKMKVKPQNILFEKYD